MKIWRGENGIDRIKLNQKKEKETKKRRQNETTTTRYVWKKLIHGYWMRPKLPVPDRLRLICFRIVGIPHILCGRKRRFESALVTRAAASLKAPFQSRQQSKRPSETKWRQTKRREKENRPTNLIFFLFDLSFLPSFHFLFLFFYLSIYSFFYCSFLLPLSLFSLSLSLSFRYSSRNCQFPRLFKAK